jgi:hypothetical protein
MLAVLRISGVLALVTSLTAGMSACTNRDVGRQHERAPAQPLEPTPSASEADASEPSDTDAPRPAPLERRVSTTLGVALQAPADWQASEPTLAGAAAFALVSSRREGFASSVNVVREPLARTTSLTSYAAAAARELAALDGYRELASREVEVAGQAAIRREYEHVQAGTAVWVVSYVLIVAREAFVITASGAATRSEAERAELDAIARSLAFEPAGEATP